MIDWVKTARGPAPIVVAIFATKVVCGTSAWPSSCPRPSWHRFPAGSRLLEQFDRDTLLLVLDQAL